VAYGNIDVPEGGRFDDMLALIGNKNICEEMDRYMPMWRDVKVTLNGQSHDFME